LPAAAEKPPRGSAADEGVHQCSRSVVEKVCRIGSAFRGRFANFRYWPAAAGEDSQRAWPGAANGPAAAGEDSQRLGQARQHVTPGRIDMPIFR